MNDRALVQNLRRIAKQHPETRRHLLPILKQASSTSTALIRAVESVEKNESNGYDTYLNFFLDLASFLRFAPNDDPRVDEAINDLLPAIQAAIRKVR